MNNVAIRVENLGKKYRIRHQQEGGRRYKALRDVVTDKAVSIFNPKSKLQNPKSEDFWALRDVSFEVKQGEAVGIIGRNGAGKSTLLKLLSRITEPTTGRIELEGRVSSLLEVGTGFHPELTGRENIYLNGAILGMGGAEIKKKFDEIVAFAEIEKFLDTPVKRYSSGMYVRLAFAVAAHLEPEILIVDEVLAVGDADFQRKCLGKMQSVATRDSRTVLFVSHTMSAIRRLCNRCILLSEGKIVAEGSPDEVIGKYLDHGGDKTVFKNFQTQVAHSDINLVQAELSKSHLRYGDELSVNVILESKSEMNVGVECALRDQTQSPLAYYGTGTLAGYEIKLKPGRNSFTIRYPTLPLAQGRYTIDIGVSRSAQYFYVLAESAVSFSVDESRPLDSGYWFAQGRGAVFIPCKVETANAVISIHK